MTLQNKFIALETSLNSEVLERQEEVHTAILALVSKRHHFQFGPPGTAKSFLVSRLADKIGDLPADGYFRYLLSQFTTPAELYGPPNINELKEKGIFHLNTEGKLPRAHIAFLDEIFRGNSSILNANLTIMNEREFYNHTDDPAIPLISLFSAANEIPMDENLAALWDRLHFRHVVQPLQEASSFGKMFKGSGVFSDEKFITLADIHAAQAEASKLPISETTMKAIFAIKREISKGKELLAPTERRWMDCRAIIQAEAWMNGDTEVTPLSLLPLQHVLWQEASQQSQIATIILDASDPLEKEAQILLSDVRKLLAEIQSHLKEGIDMQQKAHLAVECVNKLDKMKVTRKNLEAKASNHSGSSSSKTFGKISSAMDDVVKLISRKIMDLQLESGSDDDL